jgi:hydrogenase nickel incorporation protein HypA/HybF
MHELSLSESIAELVVECARREGLEKVTRVVLSLGVAAAVDADALSFCFPLTTAGTIADGAELVIERVPLKVHCEACGTDYAPAEFVAPCPVCGSYERRIVEGREMRVVSFAGT